jgi:hypothetical protein
MTPGSGCRFVIGDETDCAAIGTPIIYVVSSKLDIVLVEAKSPAGPTVQDARRKTSDESCETLEPCATD